MSIDLNANLNKTTIIHSLKDFSRNIENVIPIVSTENGGQAL